MASSFYWITLVFMATAVAAAPQLASRTQQVALAGAQLARWEQAAGASRREQVARSQLTRREQVAGTQLTRREQFTRALCGDLSPEDCRAKAGICNPGRHLTVKDSTVLSSCAKQNGIKLQGSPDATKTIDEVLRFLGASTKELKATRNCFYTHLGLMSNDVFIVEAVKENFQSTIQEKITNSKLKAAMLRAMDTCPQPTSDSIRNLIMCLAQTCIGHLADI